MASLLHLAVKKGDFSTIEWMKICQSIALVPGFKVEATLCRVYLQVEPVIRMSSENFSVDIADLPHNPISQSNLSYDSTLSRGVSPLFGII